MKSRKGEGKSHLILFCKGNRMRNCIENKVGVLSEEHGKDKKSQNS